MKPQRHSFNAGAGAVAGVLALLALSTPAEANKCDRHPELCEQPADMACISKEPDFVEQLAGGDSVDRTWQVCVENVGGSTATNVVVSDTLPEGVESLGPDPADCPGGAASSIGPDGIISVSCNVGDVPAGESRCVDFNVRIFADTPDGTNVAQVGADNDDNPDNNDGEQCTATVTVEEPLNNPVCISKTADPQAALEDATTEVTYAVTIQNIGVAVAGPGELAIIDTLPEDSVFVPPGAHSETSPLCGLDADTFDIDNDGDSAEDVVVCISDTEVAPDGIFTWFIQVNVGDPDLDTPTIDSDLSNVAVAALLGLPNGPLCVEELGFVARGGAEGCTPGFWKNAGGSWANLTEKWMTLAATDPADTWIGVGFEEILGDPGLTLEAAINLGGGAVEGLVKHAVAALLNIRSGANWAANGIDEEAELVAAVNAALASGDDNLINALKDMLDEANNAGCPYSN